MDQKQITEVLGKDGISKSSISRALKRMQSDNWVYPTEQKYPKLYKPTSTGKEKVADISLRLSAKRQLTRVEHFQIKFPLLYPDMQDTVLWDSIKPDGFNRWFRKYVTIDWPHEIRVERTTKSIIFHVHNKHLPRDKTFFTALAQFTAKILLYGRLWLRHHGIEVGEEEVISQEIENDMPEQDEHVDPHTKVTVKLGRQAESVLGSMKTADGSPIEAKAFIERSHGTVEIGTNDLTYAEKLIMMPERIDGLLRMQFENTKILNGAMQVLDAYTKQMELHLGVEQAQKENQITMNKTMDELTKGISELRSTVKDIAGKGMLEHGHEPVDVPTVNKEFLAGIITDGISALDVFNVITDLHRKFATPVYVSSVYSHVRSKYRLVDGSRAIKSLLVWLKNRRMIEFDTVKGLLKPIVIVTQGSHSLVEETDREGFEPTEKRPVGRPRKSTLRKPDKGSETSLEKWFGG